MRILVIGAGALGGYFGACLQRAGRDVSFLVRPGRAEQLTRDGLRIRSPHGDFSTPARPVLARDLRAPADIILLGTKSYALDAAMDDFAPAVGPGTVILPVLNGMSHIDALAARFGAGSVLGGIAVISASLDKEGAITQHFPPHTITFGEVGGGLSERVGHIATMLDVPGCSAKASDAVLHDMWEKFGQMAAGAGMTCMMRASLGDILAVPGGSEAMLAALAESWAVATAAGYPPRPPYAEFAHRLYSTAGSPLKASLLRDIERGAATEGDHILGDITRRARALGVPTPILDLARIHVAAYELGRARQVAG